MILKLLFPFLTSFFLTIFFTFLAIRIFKRINWQGRKSERHIHKKGVCRIGGLAMVIAFNLAVLIDPHLKITPELGGFMVASLILLAAGFYDDYKEVFWKTQLFIQVAVAIFVFIIGIRIYYITNPFNGGTIHLDSGLPVVFSVILVIGWIIAVINAINWSDGIDGLSGGVTLITSMTIFFLSLRPEVYQPPVAIISAILLGTTLAFLIFNFYPSKIIAGTSGSMFMGFSLAILAIFAGTKIATALLVLALPIIDSFWVIMERIRKNKSIFKADRNHLHYKLMELGWSQRKIVSVYCLIMSVIAFISLNTRLIGKSITLILTFLFMSLALLWVNKHISSLNHLSKNKK